MLGKVRKYKDTWYYLISWKNDIKHECHENQNKNNDSEQKKKLCPRFMSKALPDIFRVLRKLVVTRKNL